MRSCIYFPRKIKILFGLLFIPIVLGLPAPLTASAQDNANDPAGFIRSLADEAISVLQKRSGSITEREQKFRTVLRDDFAMDKIGRFAAGRYWRVMSDEQRQVYQSLFEEWILKTYSIRFGGYAGETLHVLKTTKAGDTDVFVRTRIANTQGRSTKVDWRVRRIDERFRIVDVVVEGVSMLVTQKAEFDAVFRQKGVDGLIATLRSQVERMSERSG